MDDDHISDRGQELAFWPAQEEFKDLLLDESRMRIDVLGEWIAPLVRQETKWRYKLYKDWLRFLEEGTGNAFDVVEVEYSPEEENDRAFDLKEDLEPGIPTHTPAAGSRDMPSGG